MRLKDIFTITKGTKVVLAITFSLALLMLGAAYIYYQGVNKAEDPRVAAAKDILARFDAEEGDPMESFSLLDSAQAIYLSLPDYADAYEIGVIYNNKASIFIIQALYDPGIAEEERQTLLALSKQYCDSSIAVYQHWLKNWQDMDARGIQQALAHHYQAGDGVFERHDAEKVLAKRVKDMLGAQIETPRRLSVSLTNKGTIYRHQLQPDSALACFQQALELWEHNRAAKSNLNVLMGGEAIKPSVIETLFPPDKNKK